MKVQVKPGTVLRIKDMLFQNIKCQILYGKHFTNINLIPNKYNSNKTMNSEIRTIF